MEEKKKVKVSLGTVICIVIIVLLIAALGAVYYLGVIKNNDEIKSLNKKIEKVKEEKAVLENEKENLEQENECLEQEKEKNNKIVSEDQNKDDIEKSLKEYILTEFGPKDNTKDAKIIAYEETTAEECFKNMPGEPASEEAIEEYKKQNPNLIYGYCIYSIEFKDKDKVSMAGASVKFQKSVGNTMITEAYFTLDKITNKVDFNTPYSFSND